MDEDGHAALCTAEAHPDSNIGTHFPGHTYYVLPQFSSEMDS